MGVENKEATSVHSPTLDFYKSLEMAFDHFNKELFGGSLPNCLLTLRSNNGIYGHHQADRFIAKNGDLLDEIGLNPGFFALRPIEVTLSTLAHEMVHHWQNHFGSPTASNPHNAEWAGKMEEIGLIPSNTGLPDGKQNGKKVTHFIQPEGKFIKVCKQLMNSGYKLKWFDRHAPTEHDRYEKLATELEKHGIKVKLGTPPISGIELPRSTRPQLARPDPTVPIYAPPPKKEQKRLRMWCQGCARKLTLTTELHLICGVCKIDFERYNCNFS